MKTKIAVSFRGDVTP